MMRMLLPFLFFSLLLSCTEKETIFEKEHQNVIIDGNEVPPYNGVTTVQIQAYVNKIYIDLLGREAINNEMEDAINDLKDGELSTQAREDLINALMDTDEYFDRFYEIYFSTILPGVTGQAILGQIDLYSFQQYQYEQAGDTILAQLLQPEIDKLLALSGLRDAYQQGTIDISEFMGVLVNNYFYDQINMGSENFVLACFEHFFSRYPTDAELQNGVTMVDGFPAQLLLQDGNSKNDFIEITTHDTEFFQGLVIDIYNQLLARLPNSAEMSLAAQMLEGDMDYQAAQRQVMVGFEYAGF